VLFVLGVGWYICDDDVAGWLSALQSLSYSTQLRNNFVEENYMGRIAKIKRLISTWERRDLSIMGKIIITKTFLISQLVYYMQAFIVPDQVLTQVNRILFRFIWKKKNNNRKAFEKVKRNLMCTEYKDGGLKMIDIRTMQASFILQWVPRLTASDNMHYWKIIPKAVFSSHGRNFECFHSTVNFKNFKGALYIQSDFWLEVLKTFLNNNQHSIDKRRNPILWNNTNFVYNGNTLFFEDWARKGITSICDLIHNNECILFETISQILGNSPKTLLEYITIRSVVTTFLRKEQNTDISRNLKSIPLFCGNPVEQSSIFRKMISKQHKTEPCSKNFWKRKFDYDITEDDWRLAFETTKETRLKLLQWKLLHNIYPTNIMLFKMKVTNSNHCSYCNGIVDFIEHFFFFCPFIKAFWKNIENFILAEYNIRSQLGVIDVLFGLQNQEQVTKEMKRIINHIILVGKMCISIFKKTERHSSMISLFENHWKIRKEK